jgi:Putative restriction endonuclease
VTEPPLLIVEIRSPSTALIDLNRKQAAYQEFGVPSYWIVDPDPQRPELTVFEAGPDGRYLERAGSPGRPRSVPSSRSKSRSAQRSSSPACSRTDRPATDAANSSQSASQPAPAVVTIQARIMASSCQASYRPLRPPCPADISVFSRNGPPFARACSLAIHLAGS